MTDQYPTEPNVALLFANWLRRQPRNRTFNYISPTNCCFSLYLREGCGYTATCVGPTIYWYTDHGIKCPTYRLPDIIDTAVSGGRTTFGEVLDALEAL